MRARPHHLIDIICQHGAGSPFKPHAYGHAVHTVAAEVIERPEVSIEFVVGADAICDPCVHLVYGRCDDLIKLCDPPISKQDYNDALDRRVLDSLGMTDGQQMTFLEYLGTLRSHLDNLRTVYSHPDVLALGEDTDRRMARLEAGLEKLGA